MPWFRQPRSNCRWPDKVDGYVAIACYSVFFMLFTQLVIWQLGTFPHLLTEYNKFLCCWPLAMIWKCLSTWYFVWWWHAYNTCSHTRPFQNHMHFPDDIDMQTCRMHIRLIIWSETTSWTTPERWPTWPHMAISSTICWSRLTPTRGGFFFVSSALTVHWHFLVNALEGDDVMDLDTDGVSIGSWFDVAHDDAHVAHDDTLVWLYTLHNIIHFFHVMMHWCDVAHHDAHMDFNAIHP